MSEDAFSPPTDELPDARPSRARLHGTVLMAWMIAGGVTGLAVGLTLQVTGSDPGAARMFGMLCIAGFTLAGALALGIERRLAEDRPAVLTRLGDRDRPLHAGLFAIPMVLAVPGLLALVVVGSVATSSLVPAILFGTGGFFIGWAARRLASSHDLTSALQALEVGDVQEAKRRLTRLDEGWLATRNGRVSARLNLGMLALADRDLDRAIRYWKTVENGPGFPIAAAGLALCHILMDRMDEAEERLYAAMDAPGAQLAQGQIDAVRLLLVMRRESPNVARTTGEQLFTLETGELFRGLLASLRVQTHDIEGARALLDPTTRTALEDSGWAAIVPEIAELFAEPALAEG